MIISEEIKFPTDISYGSVGGPEYLTEIASSVNGREYRNIRWQQARIRYNVASGIKTREQAEKLITFFRARKGKGIGFRFKDWLDYQALRSKIGVGNGTRQEFQLIKRV